MKGKMTFCICVRRLNIQKYLSSSLSRLKRFHQFTSLKVVDLKHDYKRRIFTTSNVRVHKIVAYQFTVKKIPHNWSSDK